MLNVLAVPTAPELARRLLQQSPRGQQVLTRVVLRQQDFSDAAATFGIPIDAFEVLFLRAAREWAGEKTWLQPDDEAHQAVVLHQAWRARRDTELVRALLPLAQDREAVLAAQQQLFQEEDASPQARRKELLRKLVIVAIILASLYLYWQRPR